MRIVYFSGKLMAIVLGMAVFSGCQNSDQRAKEREKFGIELFDKGEYNKAALELSSALKEDGTLKVSYYYLALLNEKNRQFKAMRENLIRAVKLDPKYIEARVKLGKVYLLFDELDAVINEADEILKHSKDSVDSVLLKAAVFIKQNNQGDALAIIEKVLAAQPEHVEAISLKALILMQNENFDSALMLVNPAIESGIDDISLHLLKIQLDAKQQNIDAVIVDYQRLTKLYPEKKDFKFALAKIYSQANRKEEAESILRKMEKSDPSVLQYKIVLLDFLNSIDKKRAIAQLQLYTTEYQDKPKLLFKMSQWLFQQLYFSEAKALLLEINNSGATSKLKKKAKLLLAKVFFHSKELDKASVIVDELLQENTENIKAKILKSKIYMAHDKNEEAVILLTKVLWADPQSDESLVLLAQIELGNGFPQKADKKYRDALIINPANMDALTFVVSRALKNNENGYAEELVIKALALKPGNLSMLRDLAEIKMLSKNWDGAKEILESLEKQPKGDLLAKFMTGRVYREQGNCSMAVSVFKEVLSVSSDFPDALRQIAACHEVMGQRTKMITYMESFMEKNPENIVAYLVMGQLYTLENNFEKAAGLYNKAIAMNKKAPQIYAALAKVYSKQKKFNKTIEIYKSGLEANPNNVRLSIYLASAYQKIKDYKSAAAVYEAILSVNPKLEIAVNNYAALLVDFIADKQSIEKARKMVARFEHSENPFYLDSYAWVELKSGNVDQAIVLLEKVNVMAQLAVFKFHLGVAYNEQGNRGSAVAQLQQAVEMGKQRGGFDEIELAQQLLEELSIVNNI